MDVAIHETIVRPDRDGDVVQLHISDRKPGDEAARIVLRLSVPIPKDTSPLFSEIQHKALLIARDHIAALLSELDQQAKKQRRSF